jgi:hypothetical protein
MSDTEYALLFVEGEKAGEAYPLREAEVSIGRSRSNVITFTDQELSRNHLVVRRIGSDVVVEDLESAHGTLLNDKRLRGILSLAEGDVLQFGSQKAKCVRYDEVADQVKPLVRDLDALDRAAEAAGDEQLDKTRFVGQEAGEEELDETRYQEVQAARQWDEEEDAKTRVLEDQATRMLDMDELRGLKAGKAPARSGLKVAAGVLLVAVLLIGGGGGAVWYFNRDVQDPQAKTNYADNQFNFAVRYPSIWQKTTGDPEAAIGFEYVVEGRLIAFMKIFVDQSLDHELTGLSEGFEDYKETLAVRYEGIRLKGYKTLDMNRLRIIQYGFRTPEWDGFGIFTYSGPNRYDVEVAVAPDQYEQTVDLLLDLLKSFALRDPQQVIDFPLPDDVLERRALANPALVSSEGERDLRLAQDMMQRRQVRPDNLYRAIENYRAALTKASILSSRPAYHETAARELGSATRLLHDEVQEQWFQINLAMKTGDLDGANWGLTKLMNMVPDKNDPIYRKAKETMKRYGF